MIEPLEPEPAKSLVVWVIYERPSDFPHGYVVRRQVVTCGQIYKDESAILALTLRDARAAIPPGLVNLGRYNDDDPAIKEVWI